MSAYRKKLIEVALPLAAINSAAAAEKLIHVGTASNIHAWWARRPLAACRAVIFASIVDDPSEYLPPHEAAAKRDQLFALIERLVQWDSNNDATILEEVRREIAEACARAESKHLVVVDPFCGSGSIPIEALRLGLDAIGFDLNPVAVAMSKALVEVPAVVTGHRTISPNEEPGPLVAGPGFDNFKADLLFYGARLLDRIRAPVERLYAGTYTGRDAPIAWLWCRTASCPNPACAARIPLVSSLWLSKEKKSRAWLRFDGCDTDGRVRFAISHGSAGEPDAAPVTDSGAQCLVCKTPLKFADLREQGRAGKLGFRLNAYVTKQGTAMSFYVATREHERLAMAARPEWVPETRLPDAALGFRVQKYGLTHHRDLFLDRQLAMLSHFGSALEDIIDQVKKDAKGDAPYARALSVYLALFFDRLLQTNNALVRWWTRPTGPSKAMATFDKQTVQMVWDFAEVNPLADSVGSWSRCCKSPLTALDCLPRRPGLGRIEHQDSAAMVLPADGTHYVFCTDPPYFANIGYADLSDFFYIWLRRVLRGIYPDIFRTIVVPKDDEIISDASRHGGSSEAASTFFYERLKRVFVRMHEAARGPYPATIFYAFKQEEGDEGATASTGWEGILQALVDTGWSITGTWPIRTEAANRPRGIGSNALASSVVLVCRSRAEDATSITRGELRRALRAELPASLRVLQAGNIAPVDVAQASIGPGMAIYSRHGSVVEADGSPMKVRAALQLINEVLDEYLASGEGDFDADTRFAITWYEQCGWEPGSFDDAETLAKARNIAVAGIVEAGIARSGAKKFRLLRRQELPAEYDPASDERPTVWEFTQHMIRYLEEQGEEAAARHMKRLGSRADATRELAYRLFNTCERKKWAEDARSYNGLILAWPELEKLAARMTDESPTTAPGEADKKGKKSKATTKSQQDLFGGEKQ